MLLRDGMRGRRPADAGRGGDRRPAPRASRRWPRDPPGAAAQPVVVPRPGRHPGARRGAGHHRARACASFDGAPLDPAERAALTASGIADLGLIFAGLLDLPVAPDRRRHDGHRDRRAGARHRPGPRDRRHPGPGPPLGRRAGGPDRRAGHRRRHPAGPARRVRLAARPHRARRRAGRGRLPGARRHRADRVRGHGRHVAARRADRRDPAVPAAAGRRADRGRGAPAPDRPASARRSAWCWWPAGIALSVVLAARTPSTADQAGLLRHARHVRRRRPARAGAAAGRGAGRPGWPAPAGTLAADAVVARARALSGALVPLDPRDRRSPGSRSLLGTTAEHVTGVASPAADRWLDYSGTGAYAAFAAIAAVNTLVTVIRPRRPRPRGHPARRRHPGAHAGRGDLRGSGGDRHRARGRRGRGRHHAAAAAAHRAGHLARRGCRPRGWSAASLATAALVARRHGRCRPRPSLRRPPIEVVG